MTYYEAISHDPDRLRMFNMTMVQIESQVLILGIYPFGSLESEVEADKTALSLSILAEAEVRRSLLSRKERRGLRC